MRRILLIVITFLFPFIFQTASAQHPLFQIGEVDNIWACTTGTAKFSVFAYTDSGILSYIWQESNDTGKTWRYLSDDATYQGSSSNLFSIHTPAINMENYRYRCIVSNSFDVVTSNAATLFLSDSLPAIREFVNPITEICAGSIVSYTLNKGYSGDTLV